MFMRLYPSRRQSARSGEKYDLSYHFRRFSVNAAAAHFAFSQGRGRGAGAIFAFFLTS
jgi:hypothetical protein